MAAGAAEAGAGGLRQVVGALVQQQADLVDQVLGRARQADQPAEYGQPQPPVVVRPVPEPSYAEVCFYDRTRFRGDSFCMEPGDSVRNLSDWADRISSIDNADGLSVQVCSESNYRNCRTYTTSASSLGDFDDYIVSIRVR